MRRLFILVAISFLFIGCSASSTSRRLVPGYPYWRIEPYGYRYVPEIRVYAPVYYIGTTSKTSYRKRSTPNKRNTTSTGNRNTTRRTSTNSTTNRSRYRR